MPRVRYKDNPNRMEEVSQAEYHRLVEAGSIIKPYDPERPGFMPWSANANRHGVPDEDPDRSQPSGDTIYKRTYGVRPQPEE